jgi:hypothetical protein
MSTTFWAAVASGALRGTEPERKGWKITLRDPSLPHQVVVGYVPGSQHRLFVSCNCLAFRKPGAGSVSHKPLATAARFESDEPMRIWRQHMAEAGAA